MNKSNNPTGYRTSRGALTRKGRLLRRTLASHEKDQASSEAATERRIYGALLEHVKLLQKRGYVVFHNGYQFTLNWRPVEPAVLVAKAEMLRRLASDGLRA